MGWVQSIGAIARGMPWAGSHAVCGAGCSGRQIHGGLSVRDPPPDPRQRDVEGVRAASRGGSCRVFWVLTRGSRPRETVYPITTASASHQFRLKMRVFTPNAHRTQVAWALHVAKFGGPVHLARSWAVASHDVPTFASNAAPSSPATATTARSNDHTSAPDVRPLVMISASTQPIPRRASRRRFMKERTSS